MEGLDDSISEEEKGERLGESSDELEEYGEED